MPEFSAPLRVTWELPADPSSAADQWRELVRSRVLFVEIDPAPGHLAGLAGVADLLAVAGAPRVTLAAGAPEATAALAQLSPVGAAAVDLLFLPPHVATAFPGFAAAFRSVTWALWSTAEGLEWFSGALAAARAAGGGTVAVRNPPAPAAPLTPLQRQRAVAEWQRGGAPELQLKIHDLFLSRDLGLDPFREYAGCQAGDALAHLSAEGVVTACRTLPVVLGTLADKGLREIWCGEARRELRRRLADAPAPCAGCAVAGRCRGGCRGLAPGGWGSVNLSARDPSCPGPLLAGEEGAG
ncbi:MAG: SPASM domain-containing protein [Deferrisomatales bacterium]|nr:SPASM domain-containing protein [Deferrisomatales bacterium]